MLDIKTIRTNPQEIRDALVRRDSSLGDDLDRVIELDHKHREILPKIEALKAEKNARAKQTGTKIKELQGLEPAEAAKQRAEILAWGQQPGTKLAALQAQGDLIKTQFDEALLALPNVPLATTADKDTVVRVCGTPAKFDFKPLDHLELAGNMIDTERGARLAGSRFVYLRGDLVRLELALVQWAMAKLTGKGFEPVIPPVLVKEPALVGTGFLPDTEKQIYHLPADDLYLVGTSEVALASMHANEILEREELPIRYAGFSPCFRREAGKAGAADKGLFRVHQFDKIEMFTFVEPHLAQAEHERILAIEEEILTELGLPYHVLNIAVDDLGAPAAKKYDCEAWLPTQNTYRELTSCSNTTDFQARRLKIRYRETPTAKPVHLATLNGTAVAVGRTMVAIMENHQQADGTVKIPECLIPFGAPAVIGA